jgi:hypothetical protein
MALRLTAFLACALLNADTPVTPVVAAVRPAVNDDRAMRTVREVWSTDRWFTFPKFEETARYLERRLGSIGLAEVNVKGAPADGRTQAGFWTMPMAWDVRRARLEVIEPEPLLLADYQSTPSSVCMWSGPTPAAGVVADVVEQGGDARGKFVLTSVNPAGIKAKLVKDGAVGAINAFSENPKLPDGRQWVNAWGDKGWAFVKGDTPLPCFSTTPRLAERVRAWLKQGRRVRVRATSDARHYEGRYPYVSALLPGTESAEEVLTLGHTSEQGAHDNATGVAAMVEAVTVLRELIAAGKLAKPRRGIRILLMPEMYGSMHYVVSNPERVRRTVAAIAVDTPAAPYEMAGTEYTFHLNPHAGASYVDSLIARVAKESLGTRPFHLKPQMPGTDSFLGEPTVGIPTVWPYSGTGVHTHHNSEDTPGTVDVRSLRDLTTVVASFLYVVASAGQAEREWMAGIAADDALEAAAKANSPEERDYRLELGRRAVAPLAVDAASRRLAPAPPPAVDPLGIVVRRKRPGTIPLDDLPIDQWEGFPSGAWATTPITALYWCDGKRDLAEVIRLTRLELGPSKFDFAGYFRFLERRGYVEFVPQHARLLLPAGGGERDGPIDAVLRLGAPAAGGGELKVRWTDSYGRVVEQRSIQVDPLGDRDIHFPLDLRRAVAMKNSLEVAFRGETARADFLARPPDRDWWDYRVIMWQHYPSNEWKMLRDIGINAGQYVGRNKAPAGFLLDNNLQWYAENVATDFYAEYHRYRQGQQSNAPFYAAKELYKRDPSSKEAFKRVPSLSDPSWLDRVRERLVNVAKDHSPYRPLFYDLGDESGVADLSAFWDFDFSDHSLKAMRVWLRSRYGTLDALNRQWGTSFGNWDAVVPETTNEAMRRTDSNYSSWADHKEWMDVSFADALRVGVEAIHSVDPTAHVGIAGAQMPGWGGYDYARLTNVLGFFEPYDIGNNIEIIRSLAPSTPVVTTSFASGPWEKHRVWYELLHGNRGLIIWDDKREFAGARGQEAKPYYNEIRGGVGALLINSRRLADPIAIHYSQASMRTAWMLQHQPKGERWMARTASTERLDSDFLRLRESYCRLVEDLGYQYNFVSYDGVERGDLVRGGYRVLILPDSNSLSEAEARAIRDFAARGGVVVSATAPGEFDEHSRRLPRSSLEGVATVRLEGDILNYHQHRVAGTEAATLDAARSKFAGFGIAPAVRIDSGSGVETHTFRFGALTLLALHTNPQLRVNELGPPEFKSNQRFERTRQLLVRLPRAMHVYDVRRGAALGKLAQWDAVLDPFEPRLFALSETQLADPVLSAPAAVSRGDVVELGLSAPEARIYHIDLVDPAGRVAPHYSGNSKGGWRWPLAASDAPGRWTVRVRDALTGWTASRAVEVR